MNEKTKLITKQIVIILGVFLVAIFSGALNWIFQFIIVGISYYIGGLFFPRRSSQLFDYIKLFSPFFIIYSFIPLIRGYYHLYPIILICLASSWLGLYTRHYFTSKNKTFRYLFISTYLILFIPFGYFFMLNWLSFCNAEKHFKELSPNFIMTDVETGSELTLYDINSKVTVLDFWNKSCGPCYKQFPELQNLTNYFSNKDVMVYAVHINRNDESVDDFIRNFFTNKSYTFHNVTIDDSIAEKIGITSTPTIIVLDSLKRVVFKGSLSKHNSVVFVDTPYSVTKNALE